MFVEPNGPNYELPMTGTVHPATAALLSNRHSVGFGGLPLGHSSYVLCRMFIVICTDCKQLAALPLHAGRGKEARLFFRFHILTYLDGVTFYFVSRVKSFPSHVAYRVTLISDSVAVRLTAAAEACPMCNTVCLFTPQLKAVPNYTVW